jgi:hypothetical protein
MIIAAASAENSSGLANCQPLPSLGSRDNPAQNADGSTDLYLGPQAPAGKAGNWLATVPGKGYFVILRLYGPTEASIASKSVSDQKNLAGMLAGRLKR